MDSKNFINKLKFQYRRFKNKKNENKLIRVFSLAIFVIILITSAYLGGDFIVNEGELFEKGTLEVHYLDVGQGDAVYIRSGDCDILIDAGPKSEINHFLQQLAALNVRDLDVVIATHPHEDHIGGMTGVFDNYRVKSFYMPKVKNTTRVFQNMINSVANEGLKIKTIKEGTKIKLQGGAVIEAYSPDKKGGYDDINDYSPIMKLTFGETSFMFTGDAEKDAEEEVLSKYSEEDLKADVIKFGHHGSSTSSSEEFIEAIAPRYGVISCAKDNYLGHPHKSTLKTIEKYNIKVYRTDKQGQITAVSDGETIKFTTEK